VTQGYKRSFKKLAFLIGMLALAQSVYGSERVLKFSSITGYGFDFVDGQFKEKSESISDSLVLRYNGYEAWLRTSVTELNGQLQDNIDGQFTFYFRAPKAIWVLSCYPEMGIGFISVHSDASEFGGAKSLNMRAVCR
jgi:hypothetical protein